MKSDTEKIADVVIAAVRAATADLTARCAALEARLEAIVLTPGPAGPEGPRGKAGEDGKDAPAVIIDVEDIARRAAALVPAPRDGQPGVPGAPGVAGRDGDKGEKGADGAAGRDGTLETLTFEQIDDRRGRFLRADGSEIGRIVLPTPIYQGVYVSGNGYVKGDAVTQGGSLWIAKEPTRDKPGDGVTAWQLAVKCGRDGKDGKGERGPQGPQGPKGDPGRDYR